MTMLELILAGACFAVIGIGLYAIYTGKGCDHEDDYYNFKP